MFILRPLAAALLVQTALALVPAGFTPSGLPIFLGPSGSRVQQSGRNMNVFAPNGTLIHTFKNSETATDTCSAAGIERDPGLCSVRHNGFDTTADNAIQSFNTTFVVPPLPTSFDSQIMFLSANIRPLDVNGVPFGNLRAALQYGGSGIAGTGPFWTYALQLEVPGEGFFQITIGGANITLDVGQRIDSFIVADPALAVEFPGDNWYIAGFDNIPDSPTIEVGWEVLPQVVALQLEEEGVSGPSDYPAGSFVFEQINLNLTTGPPAALYWNTSGDPATDVQVKVDVEGSRDAQVSIIFPSA